MMNFPSKKREVVAGQQKSARVEKYPKIDLILKIFCVQVVERHRFYTPERKTIENG
jgi:hypothetical protein